ncbi:MAG: GNAT family N-acetyltransferase [Defluviitaleaceae bacterium]|nr:GNAT family N-acetyltransferase [Defluviitaleaceae bacterium]
MEIIQASQASFDPKPQMSYIFVEGFYPWIKHISKNKEKLVKVFTHMFELERFYLAVESQKIAAIAACTSGTTPVCLCRKDFVQVLGPVCGNISYLRLRRHMMHNSLPFNVSPKNGVIEFVATAPEFRKQGIGHTLLTHIIANLPHETYMLEVAETNTSAKRLYDRLGFKEFKRVAASKRSGAGAYIYMRLNAEPAKLHYSAALKL